MVISMERPKILFVFNPRSGKAKIKNKLCDIIDIFVNAGYEVTVYPTQEEGDAIRAVRDKREDYALLVCSGGDGTLDEVLFENVVDKFFYPDDWMSQFKPLDLNPVKP